MDLTVVTRALNALNLRRKKLDENEKGFTLIELLVVVIIIGILAAIAIPVYLGVQNNAKDSAVKSDLTNVKTAVVSYFTQNAGAYPALTTAVLGTYGYSGTSITYTAAADAPKWSVAAPATNASTFCIVAKSPTGTSFYVSDSSGVTGTAC
ncbi:MULTISPECIES: type IV pilin protein [unclassified Cryobacterium]|uniref:type IV pilin protein n=1 Tax=unclassified Cryobacterium TaxID=2649013 RepID=UPI00241143A5|nr:MULTISPECIES: prepilin-type N-terminal cleavage/methylation domain-containing protein [Cryobacterium]MEC5152200.1 prepilin-type N-terminal cleavage/methylation domain-containing protein [Cryobacterium psychrotolerans]